MMSETKYTPGPWWSDEAKEVIYIAADGEPEVACVAAQVDEDSVNDTDRANAHLLAAAPDLLAACEKALAMYEWILGDHPKLDPDGDLLPELEALKNAIAHAKGGVS